MYYIGIDLGTSAVKMLMVDEKGEFINSVSKEYPLYFPKNGWSEQNPEDWWNAVCEGLREITSDFDKNKIGGISLGGQMHGLVMLDSDDNVIRNAILWNDGRSDKQCKYLNDVIGKDKLTEYTANIAFAGFTAPKILWVKENEIENFKRISKIMLPKDYIVYKLTGVHSTDYSDGSGMLLLDVKNKCWSKEMLDICGIDDSVMPTLYESSDVVGTVTDKAAKETGLNKNVKIIAGAGDNAAAAVGTGTVEKGRCTISLGTSGTVFISSDEFSLDKNNTLHSFAHADGKYHLMGCILSAASCNKWWISDILGSEDYDESQRDIKNLGDNNVFFAPYLMGERSPHNDPNVRGAFLGISMDTTRKDMTQAVLEGVAFALRDSIEAAGKLGISVKSAAVCGGGGKSPLWCKIIANVLNMEIFTLQKDEGPSFGSAVLAMVGCGEYENVSEAAEKLTAVKDRYIPEKEIAEKYEIKYNKFKKIYPSIKDLY